jgi:hypothetical protein
VRSERDESGLTAIKAARLERRAINGRWPPGQRWPLDSTPKEINKGAGARALTVRERLVLAVARGATSKDDRIQQIAVRNGTTMDAQNMEQESRDRLRRPSDRPDDKPEGDDAKQAITVQVNNQIVLNQAPDDELRAIAGSESGSED